MRLGILQTDSVRDELQSEFGDYPGMFEDVLDQGAATEPLEFSSYDVRRNEYPERLDECDAYLITGSKAAVYDQLPWVAQLRLWISSYYALGARLVGICFGHQIIAHSLDGQAARNNQGWGVGVHTTMLANGLLNSKPDAPATIRLLHSHQDQVIKLPPQAELLASSEFCPLAAYKIADQVLSFQGHPEFTPLYLQRLLSRRRAAIGEVEFATAMASLEQDTDAEYVGR